MIPKKLILRAFLSCVALAMLTGIAAVIFPDGWIDEKVLITIFIVGAYSLGGIVIVAAAPKHGKHKWTLRICSAGLAVSMAIYISYVWLEPLIGWEYSDYFWKPASIALIIGITTAHRLMIVPLTFPLLWFRATKRAALIAAAVSALILIVGIINEDFWFWEDLIIRLLAIGFIITAGSTIATGALALFAPKPGQDEQPSYDTSLPINLTCPRCNTSIKAQSNKDSRCPSCKLKVRIEVKEPRCTCGYLLYQLESKTCPECGKPVPQSEQWGVGE